MSSYQHGGSAVLEITLDGDAVGRIDEALAGLSAVNDDLKLNFGNHWPEDGHEVALLAAALIGSLRDRQVTINVNDPDAIESLLRVGLATALSRRASGRTTFEPAASGLDRPHLGAIWTSGSRATTEAMFGAHDPMPPGPFGRRYATFVNPHLSSGAEGHPDVVFFVLRWLTRRLGEALPDPSVDTLVATVGACLDELIGNVQEHAAAERSPRIDCLVRVSITPANRVRCSVIDNGLGIVESLAPKVRQQPANILVSLIEGQLPGWGAGRGVGLTRVRQLTREARGRLVIATDCNRVLADPDEQARVTEAPFRLRGTLIDLDLPALEL
jgi:hypothetical protein